MWSEQGAYRPAISANKGGEITEEQLEEFKETFDDAPLTNSTALSSPTRTGFTMTPNRHIVINLIAGITVGVILAISAIQEPYFKA